MRLAAKRARILSLLFVLGCREKTSSTVAEAPTAPVDASDEPLVVDASEEGDASEDVAAAPTVAAAFSELPAAGSDYLARKVGFSRDDRYLVSAVSDGDSTPLTFHFVPASGAAFDMTYFGGGEGKGLSEAEIERRQAKKDGAVDARLHALGIEPGADNVALRGPFPSDLRFRTRFTYDKKTDVVTFELGARAVGEEPVYPVSVTLGPHELRARASPSAWDDYVMSWADPALLYVNVTHDGREIGFVVLGLGSLWYETAVAKRIPTAAFVSKIYAETAKRHQGDEARTWLAKAAAARTL